MNCDNCENEHDGSYGSGRFCNKKCARAFSTRNNKEEIYKKVSKSLKDYYNKNSDLTIGKPFTTGFDVRRNQFSKEIRDKGVQSSIKKRLEKSKNSPFESLCKNTRKRILYEEQNNKCAICGIGTYWNGKVLKFHVDHINGDHSDNVKVNQRLICPNCHSQTETYCRKKQ